MSQEDEKEASSWTREQHCLDNMLISILKWVDLLWLTAAWKQSPTNTWEEFMGDILFLSPHSHTGSYRKKCPPMLLNFCKCHEGAPASLFIPWNKNVQWVIQTSHWLGHILLEDFPGLRSREVWTAPFFDLYCQSEVKGWLKLQHSFFFSCCAAARDLPF